MVLYKLKKKIINFFGGLLLLNYFFFQVFLWGYMFCVFWSSLLNYLGLSLVFDGDILLNYLYN